MGIVIGVVIDVAVTAAAAAAEAAATAAAEAVAAAAEESAEAAAEGAAEAGAEGAADAAAESAAESAAEGAAEGASITVKVLQAISKLSNFIKEFFAMDGIFRTAQYTLYRIEGNSQRVQKLEKYINVLVEMESAMTSIRNWLQLHQNDTVKLQNIDVPVDSGILSQFMTPLAAGTGNLQRIANDVDWQNKENEFITDAQIDSIRSCLIQVNKTFDSLASFMAEKKSIVPVLASFPITKEEVTTWNTTLEN